MLEIVASEFNGRGQMGDFEWMIQERIYPRGLYLFNDNIEDQFTNRRGLGNAVVRFYNEYHPDLERPITAGIPTGSRRTGGFTTLTPQTRSVIDAAFHRIQALLKQHDYTHVLFSAKDGRLGTSIFRVGEDVVQYITDKIYALGKEEQQDGQMIMLLDDLQGRDLGDIQPHLYQGRHRQLFIFPPFSSDP